MCYSNKYFSFHEVSETGDYPVPVPELETEDGRIAQAKTAALSSRGEKKKRKKKKGNGLVGWLVAP